MKSVIICDMEGLITNLNDGACEMFGYACPWPGVWKRAM